MKLDKRVFINTTYYSEEKLNSLINMVANANSYNIQLVIGTNDPTKYAKLKNKVSDRIEISKMPISFYNKRTNHNKLNENLITTIQAILNDQATTLFLDRHHQKFAKTYYGPGIHNYYRYVTALIVENFTYLESINLDYIYFTSTPHQIETWITSRVAESLGIKIILSHLSPVPWRSSLYFGIGKDREIFKIKDKNITRADEDIDKLNKWIQNVKGEYQDAIPEYERKRLEFNKGKHFNIISEVRRFWQKPHFIFNKYKCYRTYSKLSIKDIKGDYVVFFLHYQPERTTLPEAYGFTEQTIALLAIRAALPDNIKIIVKEHPSTFTNMCPPKHRHPSFYNDILAINNVELADINISSFKLIDNAITTVTLTGTVGVETLLRGKPTVYMGVPIIRDTIGVHVYESVVELKKYFKQCIIGFNKETIISNTENVLKKTLNNSIPRISDYAKGIEKITYKFDLQYLEAFIKGEDEAN